MESSARQGLGTTHVLKDGDTFVVADREGNISGESQGLFHHDTRLLSCYAMQIDGGTPLLLSSSVSRDNVFFRAHLTNRPLSPLGYPSMPQGLVYIARTQFVTDSRLHERIVCSNFGDQPIVLPARFELAADFRDMFEVRGSIRAARGELLPAEAAGNGLLLRYRGLDGVTRTSCVTFSRAPTAAGPGFLQFAFYLPPGARDELYVEVGDEPIAEAGRERFRSAAARARLRIRARNRRGSRLRSSSPLFNAWMRRSQADLALLTSDLETGPYPYAGIPWFSTPFGRDAVITALQTLWLDAALARGVLAFLAKHQAREVSTFQDAAPGKIMHETRKGEMAALRELPFGLYYGGVDTTPLFVMLAHAYATRTGDMDFIERIWPALVAAVGWIEQVRDANRLGFLDYARGEHSGLANQGWKDSEDSVFHRDGRAPVGPIALVEVQGYAFAALRGIAALSRRRGDAAASEHWDARAGALREAVERHFWSEERGYYGIAVDGNGVLCDVLASNPGHLLYVGLPQESRAERVCEQLMSPRFRTGWGLRTLAQGEARFNPMSYHNGSIWPHDSAICAAGMARYGRRDAAVVLLREAFEAAVHFDYRVPELFCGFSRAQDANPVAYPVACLPQAWAAGSPFMLAQACLGIVIDGHADRLQVVQPQLPIGVDDIKVRGLRVGERTLDLIFRRSDDQVLVSTGESDGDAEVLQSADRAQHGAEAELKP
ncbi:glycogen debranching enzyme [Luteimonas cucumeris]|uniref:Glycogen debranching enzyme n=1 Tax=Luteimonas cucumeris TaxID=985012 RepID=A0A562L250_9GAMM|nr:amylo-alpha-1,6-glucosidase [Luteimonas cucumeris]TWI01740.1 glycogen debranching enzyme [Luteimonas cucumeris]